jgi:hypothetical protein
MAKGRKERGAAERIRALLDAGDHRGAARVARAVLSDPAATFADRDAASAALAGLRPERGAVVTGAIGLAVAAAVTALLVLRS